MTDTTFFKARPTLYQGVQMRSRLEASFAENLDRGGLSWAYEPDCFAGPSGQYLPDFRIDNYALPSMVAIDLETPVVYGGIVRGSRLYVEVKPYWMTQEQFDADLKPRMLMIWESEPTAALALWVPDGSTRRRGTFAVKMPRSTDGWQTSMGLAHCGVLTMFGPPERDLISVCGKCHGVKEDCDDEATWTQFL